MKINRTNKKITTGLLMVLLIGWALPAQAQSLKDAYKGISSRILKKEYPHLAIWPMMISPSVGLPDEIKSLISVQLSTILEKEKFQLLPEQETLIIRDRFAELYGDGPNSEQQAIINEHTRRELFYSHPINAMVVVQVLAVPAPFENDRAKWGGASQKIEHRGDGFFGSIMGKDYGGNIAATAIKIAIINRKGDTLYDWMGGIEVMMQRNGDQLEALPLSDLWQSEKRVVSAVKYSLKPI